MFNQEEKNKKRVQTLSEKIIFVAGALSGFYLFIVCLVYYGLSAITKMSVLENAALVTLSILIFLSLPDFSNDE